MKTLTALLLFLIALPSLGAEGFYSIDRDLDKSISHSFYEFPEGNDCGSVRIHKDKPYFLTALHCIHQAFDPQSEQSVGSPFNYDSLTFYGSLAGQTATFGAMQIRVLTNGGCFTGFALDVFAHATASEINAGVECLTGDWLIFEVLNGHPPTQCSPVEEVVNLGSEVTTLGGPRIDVRRSKGLFHLDGRVFSRGQTFQLQDLLDHSSYPESVKPLWGEIMKVTDPSRKIMITDSDIINGMSGGPVFKGANVVGLSIVGLLPNYIYDYPGFVSMQEGYNFGIHGALPVYPIKKQNPAYFVCP